MAKEDKKSIVKIQPEHELYVCPECSYTDGFHVSFKKSQSRTRWQVILICPQCHARYQIDWNVDLSD